MIKNPDWITAAAEGCESALNECGRMGSAEWVTLFKSIIREEYDRAHPPRGDLTAGGNSPLIMFSGAVDKKEVGPIKYELMDKVWGRTFKEWLQIEEYARKHGYKPGGESAFGCNQTGAKSASAPADSPAPKESAYKDEPAPSAGAVDVERLLSLVDRFDADSRGADTEQYQESKRRLNDAIRALAAERDQYQKESIRRWEKDYFPEIECGPEEVPDE